MINPHRNILMFAFGVLVTSCFLAFVASVAHAGGPLFTIDGQPLKWPHSEVRGGPLNTQTVDEQGRVLYRVDTGQLGPLSNEKAVALVDRIFKLYTDVPTASIEFVNAGPIRDPDTGNPVDVTASNVGKYIGRNPTSQNPIIFDSDGSIVGGGGVLGFFGILTFNMNTKSAAEGFVVLNGRVLTTNTLSTTSFLGVFTHEFGHFAGPLDHAQVNGNIALDGEGSILPPGLTNAQAFDLYAPFTETLFPFIFLAPAGSQLGNQFPDSGYFVATLDMDTQNALSNLYPAPDYFSSTGSIGGRVLLKFGATEVPVSGINVIARRIDQGPYPPPLGTTAFPTPPSVDSDGVPQIPPAQATTDSLATVASAVTGVEFGPGRYQIRGLPPGSYLVEIQQINPGAIAGSSIGPLFNQFPLPVAEEFFNGPDNSSNSGSVFVPVTVTAGGATSGIDFIINGINNAVPAMVDEKEPNEKTKKAQKLSIPVELSGSASAVDDGTLRITLSASLQDFIEDLYKITVDQSRIVFIILEPTSGSGDLDMYLFTSDVSKKKTSLDDPNLLSFSGGPASNELIAMKLDPGSYIIGVSAFAGSVNYKLRIVTTQ